MRKNATRLILPVFWLLLCWLGVIILVDPRGEFPLNDDWGFSLNVKALVEENRWYFSDWTSMSLIAHTLWGSLFCWLSGFSFTALRVSVLCLGGLGGICLYVLGRRSGAGVSSALLGALLLLFFPIYFVLSFSFMTDVSFLAVLLAALIAYIPLFSKENSWWHWIVAIGLSIVATLIRQIGLVLPLGFALVYFFWGERHLRKLLLSVLPLLLTAGVLYGYTFLQASYHVLPATYTGPEQLLRPFREGIFAQRLFERTGITLFYLGWFMLPFSLPGLFHRWRQVTWAERPWMLLLGVLGIGLVVHVWHQVPYPNMFYNLGLGPRVLKDAYWGINAGFQLSDSSWNWFVRLPGVLAAGILLSALFFQGKNTFFKKPFLWWLALMVAILYQGFIVLEKFFFDRHLLLLLPLVLILWWTGAEHSQKKNNWFSLLILIPIALFSITATHDYLSWNRARWEGLNTLLEQGVSPEKIDGGFEFNGWYLTNKGQRNPEWKRAKSWWFVEEDEWLLSFGPYCGYEKKQIYAYERWLPPGEAAMWLQQHSLPDTIQQYAFDTTVVLQSEQPYAFAHQYDEVRACDRFLAEVWRYPARGSGGIVFIDPEDNQHHFFEPDRIIEQDSIGGGLLQFNLRLPEQIDFSSLKCYLWQPGQDSVVFKDFRVHQLR